MLAIGQVISELELEPETSGYLQDSQKRVSADDGIAPAKSKRCGSEPERRVCGAVSGFRSISAVTTARPANLKDRSVFLFLIPSSRLCGLSFFWSWWLRRLPSRVVFPLASLVSSSSTYSSRLSPLPHPAAMSASESGVPSAAAASTTTTGEKANALKKAFPHVDLDGHNLPPSPAPSTPRTGRRYALATELVYTESNDQYNASSVPIYQVEALYSQRGF